MDPITQERERILNRIQGSVSEKYLDPAFDDAAWKGIVGRHRESIVKAKSPSVFEQNVAAMLGELSPRSLGLLSDHTPITPRNAINASFSIQDHAGYRRWVFQDVLPGGVAAHAGAQPGDVLLTVGGEPAAPAGKTGEPQFEMQERVELTVARGIPGTETRLVLKTASPKYKDNPYSEPTALVADLKGSGLAYLKASLFPGTIGIDFASKLDALFSRKIVATKRLIVDLRGNPGGGIGGLALMSYLTADRLPVGYSKSRKMAREGQDPSSLPVFSKVPRSKFAILGLALKFMGKTSVFLYTEGLGRRTHHGGVVILVNEHTTGAAEMVAQFAQENSLATIVGTKTPGRLVSRSATKVGGGYRLIIPVAAYVSAEGKQIEGNGIQPNKEVPWSFSDAAAGRDNQLEAAVAMATSST